MAAGTVFWTTINTPLGAGMMAATEKGICRLGLPGRSVDERLDQLREDFPDRRLVEDSAPLRTALDQLAEYWRGERHRFSLPVDLRGTSFQSSVWEYLQEIPWGQTVSYGQVARSVGSPRAFQAVGRAVGSNPVPLIVPCHRVIGADGSLTGFASGTPTKKWLLEHEGGILV